MKRAVTVLLVLTVIAAVDAAPENVEPTLAHESECYECHGTEGTNSGRGGGPSMQTMFRIFMTEPPDLSMDAETELQFEIRNWWTSELQGFTGYIDITDAPSLSFEASKPPVPGAKEGVLPEYDPGAYYQGQERSTRLDVRIGTGGTDLNFTLIPDEEEQSDLIFRIWTPEQNPDVDTPLEVDAAGAGGAEMFAMRGDPITGGTYTIEVAETPDTFASPSTDMFDPVGFDLEWVLSYQFEAGATQRTGGSLMVLDGQDDETPQAVPISWPINVVQEVTQEQRIRVYMESVAYYDHPPQFRATDEWLFWNEVEYFLSPVGDGTVEIQRVTPVGDRVTEFLVGDSVIEVAPVEEEPDLTVEEEASLDAVSEVIGYIAAFLLVVSLVTGGAFGNWSRRLQQWMIYRRARKRVNFHNVLSYGLLLVATLHMVLFLVEPRYPWTVGFFLGGVSILGMYMSGVTGAFQRPMVNGMGHEAWRLLHYLSFVFAFGGAAGHVLLDGIHFADVQAAIGWQDPVAPALEQIIPVDNVTASAEPPA